MNDTFDGISFYIHYIHEYVITNLFITYILIFNIHIICYKLILYILYILNYK